MSQNNAKAIIMAALIQRSTYFPNGNDISFFIELTEEIYNKLYPKKIKKGKNESK